MDIGNGWNLTRSEWRQLHVLEWLYDSADGRPDCTVKTSHSKLACAFPGIGPATGNELRAVFECLYREHLVTYPIPYRGDVTDVPPRAGLTAAGAALIDQVRRRRADLAARRVAARDALLRWLYEQAAAGIQASMLSGFWLGSYARYLSATVLFPPAEIDDAARWLHQRGYIAGTIEKPLITPTGEKMVENGRSASEGIRPLGGTNITVTGSSGVNIAAHSPGTTQTTIVTLTSEARQHLLNLACYLGQTATQLGLSEDSAAGVPGLVSQLRSVAREQAADQGRLARLLDDVRLLAIGAASVPLGAGLQALVDHAGHPSASGKGMTSFSRVGPAKAWVRLRPSTQKR